MLMRPPELARRPTLLRARDVLTCVSSVKERKATVTTIQMHPPTYTAIDDARRDGILEATAVVR